MRIDRYQPPKSSFLSMEKDLGIIIGNMEKCSRLKRLLCNNAKDALSRETPAIDIAEMIQKGYIRIVPKITIDEEVRQYVVISFDNFTPNATNPEFRDNIISFDIICHFDNWNLGNMMLRPYKIAAEIDSMFNGKYLSGIGTLQFLGANQIILTDEFGGLSLMYAAIHGEEDKNAYTPIEPDISNFEAQLEDIAKDMGDN
jgi:hypothetical protein